MSLLRPHHLHKSRGILGSAVYSLFIPLFGHTPASFSFATASQINAPNISQARFLCEAGVTEHNFSSKLNLSFEESGKSWCSQLARNFSFKSMAKDKWLGKSDPSSFSNPEDIRTTSVSLQWKLDFSTKSITGSVVHDLVVVNPDTKELILDTRDLVVSKVVSVSDGKELSFTVGKTVSTFGEPLTIQIGELAKATGLGNNFKIEIKYSTTDKCSALQWLEPLQTAGKRHPYVFSQCQAIHARSLLPCQDTPFVKSVYNATVSVPKDLQALMSAVPVGEPETDGANKIYRFEQKIPIPSYLTAIAVGDIVGKVIGPRSRVWAEKEFVDQAAFEFSETEKMIAAAENLLGKYVWGQYDILLLPPSFPYGGMENPCLTFATPTLLAGDKSLANVIAHEIAHSWTGNLVTNKDWQHFWLNEGFTVFVERKILAALEGEESRQFASIGGWNELRERILEMKEDNPLTRLVQDLNGIDPDDAFSIVPYEKGYAFLYYLEQKVGGPPVFEPFLAQYIQENSYKSIDTDVFIASFNTYFLAKGIGEKIADIDWTAWLTTPGLPLVKSEYSQKLRNASVDLAKRWIEWDPSTPNPFQKSDIDSLNSGQISQFFQELLNRAQFTAANTQAMEKVYEMNSRQNSEIRFRWIRLAIKSRNLEIVPLALKFINEQGRMKFVRPIYRELYDWEEVRPVAIKNYNENSKYMMHVLAKMLAKDLHIQS